MIYVSLEFNIAVEFGINKGGVVMRATIEEVIIISGRNSDLEKCLTELLSLFNVSVSRLYIQANLHMTDSMEPGKLVRHMQRMS